MTMMSLRTLALLCVAAQAHKAKHQEEKKNLFVVFYAARSGSDWLLDLLDAHEDICIPAGEAPSRGEHCDGHALICEPDMEQLVAGGAPVDKAFDAAAKYRVEHPKNRTDACNRHGWKMPMQWLAGNTRHRGEHFDRASFVKWVIARRVKILLLRRDGLAWFVSVKRKNHLQAPIHCRDKGCARTVRQARIALPADSLASKLDDARRAWNEVGNWSQSALPPELLHTVYYDDLVAATAGQMGAVFRFLGVAPRPTTSDFVKTSRNNLSNKIENYKEVRQALRGTPWEIP
jgi:hypothetical protein